MGATILKTVLLSVCLPCLLLCATAGCGSSAGQDAEQGPHASESTERSATTAVIFPVLKPRSADTPDALGIGKLIVDGRGCLRLRSVGEGSATPLWPPGFELSTGNGGMRVLDTRGACGRRSVRG